MPSEARPIPDWADKSLSADLPVLRARGENQDLEYMEAFPQNARELGKEISAFATSNQGTILIGVSDTGELVGLPGLSDPSARDELLRRVEGLCRGTLRPAITPTVRFAVENGATVLVIIVPRGSQPVYYSYNIPYVRHITESRPAEPHEVLDLVRAWLAGVPTRTPENEVDPFSEVLSRLAAILFEVLIYGAEAENRMVTPWIDQWRAQYQYAATELRDIASEDIAVKRGLAPQLLELARALDDVAGLRLHMGSGPKLMALVKTAVELAATIKARWVDAAPLSADSLVEVRNALVSTARRLRELASRAQVMIDHGRIDEFQAEAAALGKTLLRIGYYQVDQISDGLGVKLQITGRRLHLVETKQRYLDGGVSLTAITKTVSQCADELEALIGSFQ